MTVARPGRADGGDREVRPYGSWPSPVTPEALVAGAAAPGEIRVDGDDVWWSESRPAEGGRVELVRRRVDGTRTDLLAGRGERPWSARTGLLEYGGGAWCVESGTVVFSQWDDQRLHRVVADDPSDVPSALTPTPSTPRGVRFGDLVALDHRWVLAVRETHTGEPGVPDDAPEPVHEIVAVPTDGSAADDRSRVRVLVAADTDFVADPRPGPARLAWIRWSHPRMPWDGTELCVARLGLDADGAPVLKGEPVVVAGGPEESVVQPEWGRDGALWSCSDRSGWWNLQRVDDPGGDGPAALPLAVAPVDAEIGGPRWVAGLRWYAPLADGRVLASLARAGRTGLAVVDPVRPDEPPASLDLELDGAPISVVSQVVAGPGPAQAAVVAASATAEPTPLLVDLPPSASTPASDAGRGRRALPSAGASGLVGAARGGGDAGAGVGGVGPGGVGLRALRPARALPLPSDGISRPEPFSFPSTDGRTAHAHLYRPTSATSVGPEGELPPLVAVIHGGPTSAARPMLDLSRQLWTSRGFAVVDVDHGGSTGYGRPYRRLLDGAWGVVDVEDCLAAARHLAAEGVVDGARMVIRGGSAGGFTTLACLCWGGVFAAGTSLYGVVDLAALAAETHKFEARYLDGLVGPWPEAAATYAERSPLTHLDELASPVLVLQGTDDEVVPPSQAEQVVGALTANGVRHAYLLFEGEGHGFRQAATIIRAVQAELSFYGQVLGFTPADDLPPLPLGP